MDIAPDRRRRLNDLMNDRRLDLGMTWPEVATAAGISYETVRALRRSTGGISELTARKLDKALQWRPGSVAAIAGGKPGTPVPLPAPGSAAATRRPAIVRRYEDDEVIGPYVRRLWDLDVSRDQRLALIEDLVRIRDSNGTGSGASAPG